jgi:hypothetical protein
MTEMIQQHTIGLGDVVGVETESNELSFELINVKICNWNHTATVHLAEHTTAYQ